LTAALLGKVAATTTSHQSFNPLTRASGIPVTTTMWRGIVIAAGSMIDWSPRLSDKECVMSNDWNAGIIEEFRANGGTAAAFAKQPILVLHTTGAKSGEERINPLTYLAEVDRVYVFASNEGQPTNPDWFHNLKAHPDVTVELGAETFPATATVLSGAERDRVYAAQAAFNPGFADVTCQNCAHRV
jgi:deazaflavin-dependent oxidoreductase (nitroreductase family)